MKKTILLSFLFIFSFSLCEGQQWLWGRMGTNLVDTWGLGIDSKSNAYITGALYDTISFGNFHLKSLYWDAYIIKYDINGNAKWAIQSNTLDSNGWCEGMNITCDKADNIIVVGEFADTVRIGSDTLKSTSHFGANDIFLAKYDKNGNFLWAKQNTNPPTSKNYGFGYAVTSDGFNNIYVTGNYQDTTSFGPFIFKTVNLNNVFLARYDSNGNVLWVQSSTAPSTYGGGGGESVAIDDSGNVYISGSFTDTISFGSYTLISNIPYLNGVDAFLVKYDKNGNVKWAWQSHGYDSSYCDGYSVLTDRANNVYLTGTIVDSAYFGPFILKGSGSYYNGGGDIFLAKFHSNGAIMWAKQSHNTNGGYSGYDLIKDTLNSLYFSGGGMNNHHIAGHLIFGIDTFQIPANFFEPSFIMKLDTGGKVLCSSMIAGGGDDRNSIICNPSGTYIYVSGDLYDSVIFNKDTLNVIADEQPFLARWMQCNCAHGNIIIQSADTVCSSAGIIRIFPSPPGGVLNGNAIYGNFFYPDSAKIGQYNLFYYDFVDSNGCVGHIPDSVYVQNCSGISKIVRENQFVISPNPNNGIFTLTNVETQNFVSGSIEIYNVLGEKVYSANYSLSTLASARQANHYSLNLNQPNGIYLYRVLSEDRSVLGSGKLIIQK